MLYQAKTLHGYKLNSLEGEIGKVKEFYFDDHFWAIRYLVADTGNWLTNRQVLISPRTLGIVNNDAQNIAVKLTKKQIEDSPLLKSDEPVSRQFEESFYKYFAVPTYWETPTMLRLYGSSIGSRSNSVPNSERFPKSTRGSKTFDPHLRSTHDVSGHHIQAKDGEIGHVEDFIIDDKTWMIRYLIVDTQNWWEGKKVLISPRWIKRVSWEDSKVFVNLSKTAIKQSPEYIEGSPLNREYETALHQHYNFQGYWVEEPVAKKDSS
jgi:sporulation protein YlmC with PRC-barrel domain